MRHRIGIVLALFFGLASSAARGDIVVSLNDLGIAGVEVIIADNGAAGTLTSLGPSTHADADPVVGQVSVPVGLTAGNFLIDPASSAFGIGGGPDDPLVDLLLFVEALGPGVLEAMVTSTNISTNNPVSSVSGNLGGISLPAVGPNSITYVAGLDPGNGQFTFPGGSSIGPVSVGGSVFGVSQSTPIGGSTSFSLSESITVTAGSPGQVIGFDAQAQADADPPIGTPVPEPASWILWLVGSGMAIGMAKWRSKRGDLVPSEGSN